MTALAASTDTAMSLLDACVRSPDLIWSPVCADELRAALREQSAVSMCVYVCMCVSMCERVCTCRAVCARHSEYVCVCACVCMYVRICMYVHVCIYTHTNIHTRSQRLLSAGATDALPPPGAAPLRAAAVEYSEYRGLPVVGDVFLELLINEPSAPLKDAGIYVCVCVHVKTIYV